MQMNFNPLSMGSINEESVVLEKQLELYAKYDIEFTDYLDIAELLELVTATLQASYLYAGLDEKKDIEIAYNTALLLQAILVKMN